MMSSIVIVILSDRDPHHRCSDVHTHFAVCKIIVSAYDLTQEGKAFQQSFADTRQLALSRL
jgi:hypothetical protein